MMLSMKLPCRLSDGTISDAIGTYSQETQNLFEAWQNGEVSQKAVIDSIVEDIGRAQTEQEALNLAATAFGTIGEDFNLRFVQSLSSVGTAYEDVSGKAQNMYQQTTTPQQELTAKMRELQEELAPIGIQLMELASQILPPLMDVVKKIFGIFIGKPDSHEYNLGNRNHNFGIRNPHADYFGGSRCSSCIRKFSSCADYWNYCRCCCCNFFDCCSIYKLENYYRVVRKPVSTVWESIKTNIYDGVNGNKRDDFNTISAIESAWSAGWTSIKTKQPMGNKYS